MYDIYCKFRKTIESRKLISPGDNILLSLSAGKDSMAMLSLMLRYSETAGFKIGIFHLNHHTRGIESDDDMTFVKIKAAEYGIPFYERSFDFKINRIAGISFEEQARDVRYGMLKKIMDSDGFNKAATAHNSRDNVETVLMRIFSGTGIYGLKGINYINGNVIRPLLDISPDEIYLYLQNNDLTWREDSSNHCNDYRRNYIRNSIIPAIKNRFADAEKNINRLSAHADENEKLLLFLTDNLNPGWLTETDSGHFILIDKFSDNIPFVKYMLSRTLYANYGLRLNSIIFEEIIRRFKSPKSNLILYEKGDLQISKLLMDHKSGIVIINKTTQSNASDTWQYTLKAENKTSLLITELGLYLNYRYSSYEEYTRLKNEKRYIFINIPDSTVHLLLRNRRDGDRIALKTGIKKIKELMIEKKLDTITKKSVPLIVIDGEIAAYLPGAKGSYPNRVSCNFWVDNYTKKMFVFYFTDVPDFNIIK